MRPFEKFSNDDWQDYYHALNQEKSVEECGLKLTDEEKERYNEALASLQADRKKWPDVPIMYEMRYKDYE